MRKLLNGMTLDAVALERIAIHQPIDAKPYLLAYSGGKDSTVILDLIKRSGIPFEAVYNLIPMDPPELRRFIRDRKRDPANRISVKPPTTSFVAEARRRRVMPTRVHRWCCQVFKEFARPPGRTTILGIRAAESPARRRWSLYAPCRHASGHTLNPIIDWTDADVWQYIRQRGLPYCTLYDNHPNPNAQARWTRIGCILCPLARNPRSAYQSIAQAQIRRWPNIARLWRRVCDTVYPFQLHHFTSADDLWRFWLEAGPYRPPEADAPLFDAAGMDADPAPADRLSPGVHPFISR